jgi:hypothetical protein
MSKKKITRFLIWFNNYLISKYISLIIQNNLLIFLKNNLVNFLKEFLYLKLFIFCNWLNY